MTPHLQVKTENGVTRIYYQELPEEPNEKDYSGHWNEHAVWIDYNEALTEALSKGIEVHPQSMELALGLVFNQCNSQESIEQGGEYIPDGLYPVSVSAKQWASYEENGEIKQYAILYEL